MDNSTSLEFRRVFNKQNDVLGAILEQFQKNGVPGAEAARNLISVTPQSLRQRAIDSLKQAWNQYLLPSMQIEEFYSLVETFRREQHTRQQERELAKHTAQFQSDVNQPSPSIITVEASNVQPSGASFLLTPEQDPTAIRPSLLVSQAPFELTKFVIFKHKITKGIDPSTLQILPRPLEFVHPLQLSDFEVCLKNFPLTNILNLESTLMEMLNQAQEWGFSKVQFSKILKLLVQDKYKEHYFVVENLTAPDDIFTQVLDLLNVDDIIGHIQTQLTKFTRQTDQPIGAAFKGYKSLVLLKLKYTDPHLTQTQCLQKAERLSLQILPDLLTDLSKQCFQAWIKDRKFYGDVIQAQECIDYISSLESSHPKYKLEAPKNIGSTLALTNVDLFPSLATRSNTKNTPYVHQQYTPPKRNTKTQNQPQFPQRNQQNHHQKNQNKTKQQFQKKHFPQGGRTQPVKQHQKKFQKKQKPMNQPSSLTKLQDDLQSLTNRMNALTIRCERCNQLGHNSERCFTYSRTAARLCSACHQAKHFTADCKIVVPKTKN